MVEDFYFKSDDGCTFGCINDSSGNWDDDDFDEGEYYENAYTIDTFQLENGEWKQFICDFMYTNEDAKGLWEKEFCFDDCHEITEKEFDELYATAFPKRYTANDYFCTIEKEHQEKLLKRAISEMKKRDFPCWQISEFIVNLQEYRIWIVEELFDWREEIPYWSTKY